MTNDEKLCGGTKHIEKIIMKEVYGCIECPAYDYCEKNEDEIADDMCYEKMAYMLQGKAEECSGERGGEQ